uniref:Uncharacterized protein LOC117352501 n=1 Tax=Geotrypetes seraphini TaxID=260995 RepID=A0A6P8QYJ1_GEOSA|nr:uncharacterized protein LOC117352501 [Geotrypetes seraphini]XP_033792723.1 uncharacterized protein LOC117356910 [Geotrypetes seraphini]
MPAQRKPRSKLPAQKKPAANTQRKRTTRAATAATASTAVQPQQELADLMSEVQQQIALHGVNAVRQRLLAGPAAVPGEPLQAPTDQPRQVPPDNTQQDTLVPIHPTPAGAPVPSTSSVEHLAPQNTSSQDPGNSHNTSCPPFTGEAIPSTSGSVRDHLSLAQVIREAIATFERSNTTPQLVMAGTSSPGAPGDITCGVTTLASSVPRAIKEKIWRRDYIDMFSLIQREPDEDYFVETDRIYIQLEREKKPKIYRSLANWISAFHVFMSVVVEREPDMSPYLIRYSDTIIRSHKKFGGWAWLNYDIKFRKSMAENKSITWKHRVFDLWMDEMSALRPFQPDRFPDKLPSWPPGPVERPPTQPTYVHRQAGPYTGKRVCRQYNNGHCTWPNCKFRHVCNKCGGTHPAVHCKAGRDRKNSTPPAHPYMDGAGPLPH